MSVIYCAECGKKHEYNFAKPNFCSSCGNSFGAAKSKKINQPDPQKEYGDGEDIDDDDEHEFFSNSTRVPNIKSIQVDIETHSQYNTFDLASIIGSESNSTSRNSTPKRKARSISIEDFKNNKK